MLEDVLDLIFSTGSETSFLLWLHMTFQGGPGKVEDEMVSPSISVFLDLSWSIP